MPELIATRDYRYGGRALRAGDTFTARGRDARLLKAIRKAEDVPMAAPAEGEPDDVDAPPAQRGRGRYQRRDLRAED